ncbi:hypothetical protein DYB28_013000 [Aphanomyces astaci]|uniref:Uncharacterized protein n=1 Tax=Aphanomyces astaci TaxID=112090 RepID=A0A9X8H7A9_APHAT|nr:hypothetical protein DYB28_013000 [Aphanomyces astaci]
MVMLGDVLVAILYSLAAPLVVLFHRPHAKWSYMEALSQRLMSHFTPLGIDVVRFGFAFFGRVQRLAYWRTIVAWRDVYLNNDVTKIHEASPGLQSLDGLPPLMVGDIATFVAKAKRCHVEVTEYLHPYLYHDFIIFPLGKPSRDAIHALAQFVVLKLDNHSNNTN